MFLSWILIWQTGKWNEVIVIVVLRGLKVVHVYLSWIVVE